jgi:2-iminobutanoate/2-iminopropanoate deaminase
LTNVQTILQLAGLEMDDIVKTTVLLTDWRHYTGYNDVYKTFFTAPYPTRSTVCGGLPRSGALLAIEAIVVAGARQSAVVATSP